MEGREEQSIVTEEKKEMENASEILADENLQEIFSFLPLRALYQVMQVNKHWNGLINKDQSSFWKFLAERDFPGATGFQNQKASFTWYAAYKRKIEEVNYFRYQNLTSFQRDLFIKVNCSNLEEVKKLFEKVNGENLGEVGRVFNDYNKEISCFKDLLTFRDKDNRLVFGLPGFLNNKEIQNWFYNTFSQENCREEVCSCQYISPIRRAMFCHQEKIVEKLLNDKEILKEDGLLRTRARNEGFLHGLPEIETCIVIPLLHLSAWLGNSTITRSLLEKVKKPTKLEEEFDVKEEKLEKEFDVNEKMSFRIGQAQESWWGYTPLHIAAHQGHVEIVRILISQDNIQINLTTNDDSNYTALYLAIEHEHWETARLLLRQKIIDVNIVSMNCIPFSLALQKNNLEFVRLLFPNTQVGQDIDFKSTPLYLAVQYGSLEITKYLLQQVKMLDSKEVFTLIKAIWKKDGEPDIALFKLLVRSEKVNFSSEEKADLLYQAGEKYQLKAAEILIKSGAKTGDIVTIWRLAHVMNLLQYTEEKVAKEKEHQQQIKKLELEVAKLKHQLAEKENNSEAEEESEEESEEEITMKLTG